MKVEVGQVRISADGARQCDVNEKLGDPQWFVCRTRTRGKHGAPLAMFSDGQILELFPVVVSPE